MREFAQHHQQISHNCGEILTETENIDECERREEDSAWNAYELLLLLRTMSAAMETEARFMIPQLSENADDFNEKPFFFQWSQVGNVCGISRVFEQLKHPTWAHNSKTVKF